MRYHFFLLRGLIRESGHWGDFKPYLQRAFKKARITAIDIPGTGVYCRQKTPWSVAGIVKKTRQQYTEELAAPGEQKVLVAISLGGMIAAEWSRSFGNDFDRMVIMNSSFRGFSPMYRRLKLANLPMLVFNGMRLNIDLKEERIIELVSNRPEKYAETLKLWSEIQYKRPVSVANSFRQLIAATRFSAPKKRPLCPVLLLSGEGDRMVSPQCTLDIEKRWQVPHRPHPDAGHSLALDEPEWVLKQMKNWLKMLAV